MDVGGSAREKTVYATTYTLKLLNIIYINMHIFDMIYTVVRNQLDIKISNFDNTSCINSDINIYGFYF